MYIAAASHEFFKNRETDKRVSINKTGYGLWLNIWVGRDSLLFMIDLSNNS